MRVRCCVVLSLLAAGAATAGETPRLVESFHFERNSGQTDARVEYLARGRGYALFLTPSEAVLSLSGIESAGEKAKAAVLRMRLVDARPAPELTALDELPGKSHYYLGSDSRRWQTDVPHYGQVRYREVYPGIDLVFYGQQGRLEYDFVVAPGADPGRIRMAFTGARRIQVDGLGDLVIEVGAGEVVQQAPVVYQEVGGARKRIAGHYVLKGRTEVAFQVEPYDRTAALVIDPVLVYSTYLGGSADDWVAGIALDSSGNVYVTGATASANFPTAGTPSQPIKAPLPDAYVAKLGPSSALIYSTFLGGNSDDNGSGIAIDGAGNAYVTGWTSSTDFPTAGTPSQTANGGQSDAFVAKLGPTSALVYSTYAGGSKLERGIEIAVDGSGNAYVFGVTLSTDFPTAGTPSQPTSGGGSDDFVMKLDSTSARVYSTYLGGDDGEGAEGGIAVDGSGNAYVAGYTSSRNFPLAGTPSQAVHGGGIFDAFVTKLGPASARIYSTYLGGIGEELAYGIALDASGSAYVCGSTGSSNFPTAGTPSQPVFAGGSDGFVTKLGPASQRLLSTYVGGQLNDGAEGIAVDPSGFIYVAGSTSSLDFPTAGTPLQATLSGSGDAFVTRMDPTTALAYSTYLGGTSGDVAHDVVADGADSAYVAGITFSADFPTAGAPAQAVHAGGGDGFVVKIFTPGLSVGNATVTEGNAGTVDATFTVRLSEPSSKTVTVDYATADGSATAGSDYVAASGTLSFAPGVTTRTVTVAVNGDALAEPDETFFVNLSNPTNARIADGQGLGTIVNDEIPGYGSTPAPPGPIAFGSAPVGTSVHAGLEVRETGTALLVVGSPTLGGANAPDFSVGTSFPLSIADGGPPRTVDLTCTPSASGARSATLTLTTNDPARPTVLYNLTCTGLVAGYASTPAPPGPIGFGSTGVGTTVHANFEVRETGTATLLVSNPTLGGANAPDFAVVTGFPLSIADGGPPRGVDLTCTPSASGTRSATLGLTTNDPARPSVLYNLTCTGLAAAYGSTPAPPGPIAFGSALVGTIVHANFEVRETGTATLIVSNPVLGGTHAGDFTVLTGFPLSITDGGAPRTVELACTPSARGLRSAALALTTNDPSRTAVLYDLTCTGVEGLMFYTVNPCRVLDTRTDGGPLAAGETREVVVAGSCGIPPTAKAVSLNLTVTQPSVAGNIRLFPSGAALPTVSSLNYQAGQTRGNNALVGLSTSGALAAFCSQSAGSAHLILDVNGYFE